ncbi:hypothetical protein BGX31_002776 [Mortierella sp. GBA43]|nr:hypothetical protein BGX31_002776 [Mortierella sp. GBA43]
MKFTAVIAILASALMSVKSYIIVLKNTVETQDIATAEREIVKVGGTIQYRYTNVLKGFSAWLSTRAVKSLTANPLVDYIEEDQQVHTLPSSTQPEAQ